MGALLDKCRSCSSYWTASQRLNRATHVDEACGPPVCIAPGRTMVNHFEPEPREVLSRVEVPTVEASDDRVDALLLFAAVDRRFYQQRSEEHTSELQSLMRISYAVFCLKKKKKQYQNDIEENNHHNM